MRYNVSIASKSSEEGRDNECVQVTMEAIVVSYAMMNASRPNIATYRARYTTGRDARRDLRATKVLAIYDFGMLCYSLAWLPAKWLDASVNGGIW